MNILVSKYQANEIAKSIDFDYDNDREYDNLCTLFEELFVRSANDSIIGGLNCQERSSPSMNVDLTIGLGYCKNTGKIVHTGSLFGPTAIVDGGAQDRIDVLEIRLKETDYDQQQRAFKDPVTGYITYQDVFTKTRFEIEVQVIQGTEGAGVAPNHTTGWIKIAEISVDAGETTSILNADIENCTGGYDTEVTTNWTAQTAITFRLGCVEDFKAKFRTRHKEDGDFKDDIIKDQHIDFGVGANQVSAVDIPIADAGSRITATETEGALQEIAGAGRTDETIKDNHDKFGVDHKNADGDHKDNIIKDKHIDWGTGAGQVSAVDMPVEDAEGKLTATEIEAAVQEMVGRQVMVVTVAENVLKGDPIGVADGKYWKAHLKQRATVELNAGGGILSCPCKLSDDFMALVYQIGGGSTIRTRVVEWDGSALTTASPEYVVSSQTTGEGGMCVHLTPATKKFAIVWWDDTGGTDHIECRIAEYNGTDTVNFLTVETEIVAENPSAMSICHFKDDIFVVVWSTSSGSLVRARVMEYNGAGGITFLTTVTTLAVTGRNGIDVDYLGNFGTDDERFALITAGSGYLSQIQEFKYDTNTQTISDIGSGFKVGSCDYEQVQIRARKGAKGIFVTSGVYDGEPAKWGTFILTADGGMILESKLLCAVTGSFRSVGISREDEDNRFRDEFMLYFRERDSPYPTAIAICSMRDGFPVVISDWMSPAVWAGSPNKRGFCYWKDGLYGAGGNIDSKTKFVIMEFAKYVGIALEDKTSGNPCRVQAVGLAELTGLGIKSGDEYFVDYIEGDGLSKQGARKIGYAPKDNFLLLE